MTRTAYLISHTHWDREWYRTFQQFRLDLVRTIDGILDTLDADPAFTHFLLDGQTIVLDDYLVMRPERANDLRRHIAAGRLAVGPWYCHPDLFLVSGESLVRNLMLGMRMARAYGRCMMVGYIPDQFGHTGQLPQIFHGVGIESAVLWRGVNARETRNESWWEAPDGSRVLLELLAQSYSVAQALPLDPTALAGRLRQLCDLLARRASGPGVLLMNGGDHLTIQSGLPAALAEANRLLAPDWRVVQVGLDEAITRLRDEGRPEGILSGELRSSATAHLLPGVLSARIPLKQRNVRAQYLLEREVEPYAAWASVLGAAYPHGEIWEAWRLLLQNQPHDSICGCSIDQVHREMEIRYDGVEQIGNELIARALRDLAGHIDTRVPDGYPTHSVPIVVMNPGPGPRSDRVRLTLQLPGVAAGYEVLDDGGQPVPHHWLGEEGEPSTIMPIPRDSIPSPAVVMAQFDGNRIMGMGLQRLETSQNDDGLQVEVTVGSAGIMSREELEATMEQVQRLLDETDPAPVTLHIHRNAIHELEALVRDVPAYGYTTLWLRPSDAETLGASPTALAASTAVAAASDAQRIENERVVVVADPATGALTITDRRTGIVYEGCNTFIDSGDAGDSYTYAPPAGDSVVERPAQPPTIEISTNELGASLRVEQELIVPIALSPDRASRSAETTSLHISSEITVTHDSPRIEVRTTVMNRAEDHRLRVRFQAPFVVDHVHADGAFAVTQRPLGTVDKSDDALEDPVPDAPQQGVVLIHAGDRGIAIASVGLPEYEAVRTANGTTLALTLLRCVGWLSRDDVSTRRGGAGPTLPVPEAQCPGLHSYSYSLIPYSGDWRDAVAEAQRAQTPLRAIDTAPSQAALPSRQSFLSVEAPGVLLSAVKGAEDREGVVVRLYNVAAEPVSATLRFFAPIRRVERLTLDERLVTRLHDGEAVREIGVEIGAHTIETLRLVHA